MADDDAAAFRGLLRLPDIKFRLACFHAQQAVEKSLKAVLVYRGIEYHKTHDLNWPATLLINNRIQPPYSPEKLTRLNPFAVTFRYDDTDIPRISGTEVKEIVYTIRHWAGEIID